MSDIPKILLVVEGRGAEPRFLKTLAQRFWMNAEIVPVEANLYMLYDKMEDLGFACDVKDVLKALNVPKDQKSLLNGKYAYTYLVFDCDAHHDQPPPAGVVPVPLPERVAANMEKLLEMAEYFTDETDPSKGRLYVNWPMLESFRDCDSCFEDAYQKRMVSIEQMGDYKHIVGARKLASRHLSGFTENDFRQLMHMNLRKLNVLHGFGWTDAEYDDYRQRSEGAAIARKQAEWRDNKGAIAVLNTVLFIPVDYFGRKFFEGLA